MSDGSVRLKVLVGLLVGVGAGAGAVALSEHFQPPPAPAPPPEAPTLKVDGFPRLSFAQQGEDIVVEQMAATLDIGPHNYLDIGAHQPILRNNTYLFYALGWRGVLVEPNPYYVAMLKHDRPEDTVLGVGIGPHNETAADYYEIEGDGQMNTFSLEQVEALKKARGAGAVTKVSKIPLLNINDVITKYFPAGGPAYVSVDTEGLDLDILRSLDFDKHRPAIICAETLEVESQLLDPTIAAFLATKHYTARGGSMVNTIFVADEVIARAEAKTKH